MDVEKVRALIAGGERIDVELKESRNSINKDTYDTVCSFNNRNGGYIILGVTDNQEIVGVNKDRADNIIKDFTNGINNPEKICPPIYLEPKKIDIDGKLLIVIYVPEGADVCRHRGKIMDRSNEGDINITNNSKLVFNMYARKQNTYFVNKVYPNLDIDKLDYEVIDKAKQMAITRNQQHSWSGMNPEELLRSANLILTDPNTNQEGITLAAILLFGKENTIMSVLPNYKTDAIFRVKNIDRYDDRDVICTNLIDSYERLIRFGQKHLNDIFVLDGMTNVSARDLILREIVSNTLAHRDYAGRFTSRMIIDDKQLMIENSNLAHGNGPLDLLKFTPYAKNPTISKVFREIGIADELGSGMRNTYKYTKLYSGNEPIFEEGHIFKTIIPLTNIAPGKVGGIDGTRKNIDDISTQQLVGTRNGTRNGTQNGTQKSCAKIDIDQEIKKMIIENNKVTRKEMALKLGVGERTVARYLKAVPSIVFIGRGKNGYWKILN